MGRWYGRKWLVASGDEGIFLASLRMTFFYIEARGDKLASFEGEKD